MGTFKIVQSGKTFVAQDTCGFNNWGRKSFATKAEAEDWAIRAEAFKRGKRQTVERQVWE